MQFKQKKLLLYYQPTPTTLHDMGDSTLHTTLTHVVPRSRLKRLERKPSPECGSCIVTALHPRFHKAHIIGGIGEHRNTLVVFSSLVHLSMPECQRISVNCMLAGWTHTQAPRMSHLTVRVHARGNRGGIKGPTSCPQRTLRKSSAIDIAVAQAASARRMMEKLMVVHIVDGWVMMNRWWVIFRLRERRGVCNQFVLFCFAGGWCCGSSWGGCSFGCCWPLRRGE